MNWASYLGQPLFILESRRYRVPFFGSFFWHAKNERPVATSFTGNQGAGSGYPLDSFFISHRSLKSQMDLVIVQLQCRYQKIY
jgi:hypothetical protein